MPMMIDSLRKENSLLLIAVEIITSAFRQVSKLSDKDGLTITSNAVILSTLKTGSGLPFTCNKLFTHHHPIADRKISCKSEKTISIIEGREELERGARSTDSSKLLFECAKTVLPI